MIEVFQSFREELIDVGLIRKDQQKQLLEFQSQFKESLKSDIISFLNPD